MSTLQPCAACGAQVEPSSLVLSAGGEICGSCDLDQQAPRGGNATAIVALIGAGIPFFASFTSSSSRVVGGQVEASFIDYVAVGGGAVALVAGGLALLGAKTSGSKSKVLTMGAVAVALGLYHLLRGFGVV